ncbi:MAG TPA: Cof-type HAD-IIB family hydrolase [Candidatus Limnocylindrales bacterium]|nr:Cof-type HAD-IIB family hydrolase [Candidatus Limnocylindrales bacterium]
MPVQLIALDIDGTLLSSRFTVSDRNRAAIAEAVRRGIEVALVTGRRYDFAMPVAQQIDSPLTMIVNNGALVRTKDGHTLARHLLPRETALRVLAATHPWRDAASVVFDRPLANQVMMESIDLEDGIRGAYYKWNQPFLGEAKPLEICLTEDPIQIMLSGPVQTMRAAERALRSVQFTGEFSLAVTAYESKDFSMIDVLNPQVSKGVALAEWAALRGIPRQEILAIGDNHNDEEMLSFAGIPVVMENAVPELKTRGWHVTHTNDDDGVAAAIERFALPELPECA